MTSPMPIDQALPGGRFPSWRRGGDCGGGVMTEPRMTQTQMARMLARDPRASGNALFNALAGGFAVHNGPRDAITMALEAMIDLLEIESAQHESAVREAHSQE